MTRWQLATEPRFWAIGASWVSLPSYLGAEGLTIERPYLTINVFLLCFRLSWERRG